jgi:membrane protein YqaA with SNARE-associated domain
LLAGVADIGVGKFATAIAIGRGARYFTEGLLAVWYGEQAMDFMRQNGGVVSLAVVACLAVALVGYVLWRKAVTRRGG